MVICEAREVGGKELCSHEVEGLKLLECGWVGGECVSDLVAMLQDVVGICE